MANRRRHEKYDMGGGNDRELRRNGSGYYDPTAYKALKNYEREANHMEYKRGEIFKYNTTGGEHEILIVSSNERCEGYYLNALFLNDNASGNYVQIVCGDLRYVDCDKVSLVTASNMGEYIRTATEAEMLQVDNGIIDSLGLVLSDETDTMEQLIEEKRKNNAKDAELEDLRKKLKEAPLRTIITSDGIIMVSDNTAEQIIRLETERDMYKEWFEKLMEKAVV